MKENSYMNELYVLLQFSTFSAYSMAKISSESISRIK